MVTSKQIAALKYLIFNSKRSDLTKRLLTHLIHKSEGLKREVCLTLWENREGYTAKEIRELVEEIDSDSNQLHGLTYLAGADLTFSLHYGDFDPQRSNDPFSSEGQFAGRSPEEVLDKKLITKGMPLRYTFWLGKGFHSRRAHYITTSRAELEKINIHNSGLYPGLERAS